MIINRRGILGGLASMLAAPAIVHAGNLMPVKAIKPAIPMWIEYTVKFENRIYFFGRDAVFSLSQVGDLLVWDPLPVNNCSLLESGN